MSLKEMPKSHVIVLSALISLDYLVRVRYMDYER